jgi:2-isopropylmalate synthase
VMTPEMVGATREFVLGKHTGTHSVRKRLKEIGYDPTDSEVRAVTRLVKDYGADKQRVTMADLRRFAREENVTREEEVRA